MRINCSFCNAVISPGTSPDAPVSHGMCKSCHTKIIEDHGFNIQKFLNMLDAPVFLVDSDVNILAANTLAIAAVGKPVSLVRKNPCGNVFECAIASFPEDAGKPRSVLIVLSGSP
ncbi:MAG: hypothetical protein M0Q91_09190 [Methanoregula sp.]|jgi:GTP:adenosylcobinamide-phosphate guanylyltransferase|nr:hypothetical protein [Methanoregula sp.]